MELKPGYKQTEVGVIPEDWEIKKLGELARFRTGPFGSTLHKEDYTNNGIPIVNPMHIVDGNIVATQEMTITAQRASELADFRLWEGDIVIGRRGEMGRCAVVKAVQNGWLCGTGSMIIRTNPLASADFLQLVLSSPPIVAAIENASVGSTMINLNQSVLAGLKVALPGSKEEQETISSSINAAGAQVEVLQALITKKQQIKQATMQELLTGKRRLPGFEGEWGVKRLGVLGEFIKGSGVKKDETTSGDLPCVRYGEIYTHHEHYISEFRSHITKYVALNATAIRRGDILFAGSGETKEEIGKSIAHVHPDEAFAGGDIVILRQNANDPLFLGYRLNAIDISRQKAGLGQGDAVVHISANALSTIRVSLPRRVEQEAIASILYEMDTELRQLHLRLAKTRALKQGMMQQLLTGKIRLR